jgi:hypothetical protein
MAKMRYDSANNAFEFEGTPQELLSVYDGLKQRKTLSDKEIKRVHERILTQATRQAEHVELESKMPTSEQLVSYILSKPKFEHDIVEVGIKFFGKAIKSRKYGKLYRELRDKLEKTRKLIEADQHGAFERRSGRPRNLQVYTFRSVSATPLEIQAQRHPSP